LLKRGSRGGKGRVRYTLVWGCSLKSKSIKKRKELGMLRECRKEAPPSERKVHEVTVK